MKRDMAGDRANHDLTRRRELAAAIGLDPRKLWPSTGGQSGWPAFELDAYLDAARALPRPEDGHSADTGDKKRPADLRHRSSRDSTVGRHRRFPVHQKLTDDDALSALGAAGRFLLSPEQAEAERLSSLRETELLHTGTEEPFDRIVTAARQYFDVVAASLSLIAEDAQYFKSVVGPLQEETPRLVALCTETVERNAMLIINDTLTDAQFASNPLVVGEPFIRFYAGYPLHGPRGWNVGTLCIVDQKPRTFPLEDQQVLRTLAAIVQKNIDARHPCTTNGPEANIQRPVPPEN